MTKIQKIQIASLNELTQKNGVVAASAWTNGAGRYTTKRAIPPFCSEICRQDAGNYTKKIQNFFKKNKNIRKVIAIINVRSVNKILKAV